MNNINKIKKFLALVFVSLACVGCCTAAQNTTSAKKPKDKRTLVVETAKKYLGCPYKSAGIGPNSFDCSGLVYAVMKEAAGLQLPRSAKTIYAKTTKIKTSELQPGDLVFFKTTGNGTISHVGIYIGNNQFIHAASAGSKTGVIISSLKEKYYVNCYAGAGRVLSAAK